MPADTDRSVFLPALGIVKVNRVPRAQTRSAALGPDAAAVGFH